MGILDDDVQRVREATDIVALSSEHVALEARRPPILRASARSTPRSRRRSRSAPRKVCFTASAARRAATRSRSSARSSISTSSKRSNGSRRVPASRCATTTRRSPRNASASSACTKRSQAAIDFYHQLPARVGRGGNRAPLPAQPRLRRRRGAPVLARVVARRVRRAEHAPAEEEVRRATTSSTPGSRS